MYIHRINPHRDVCLEYLSPQNLDTKGWKNMYILVVESLLNMFESLGSIPSIKKINKERKKIVYWVLLPNVMVFGGGPLGGD